MSAVPLRVLLVDDVADLRFLLRVVFETDGAFEVVGEAGDGETAVALCVESAPDVIVLDLSMPTMDGLEALPRLRQLAPDATIVVLSGFEKGRVSLSTAELGADAYFEKGTSPTAVLDALKELLGMEPAAPGPISGTTAVADEELHALVAHDLRSPLAAIVGFGETLDERWDELDDSLRRGLVGRMTKQARVLRTIADNLLSARAIDLAELVLDLRPVAPAALIPDIADVVRPMCGDHALGVQVSPELPVVVVDRTAFFQVILNLVSNAVRHSPPGSPIGLTARADGAWVAVEVTDRGPGIPTADRVRVLEKHVRLTRESKGLGLGLYVAACLSRAMGGALAITDVDGVGTRAVCRLKVAESAG
jgi:signal transduction histidine kinase